MATGKKSALLYCDLIHTVEKLDDKTAGELFKHYLRYINDLDPKTDNMVVDVVFEQIKQNLKRDLLKWEQRADRSRENGSKGGRPPKPKEPSGLIDNPTEPEKPDTVTGTVTGKVKVTGNGKEIRELTFREQVAQHTTFESTMLDSFCEYWTESNTNGKKMKFEMQKTFDISRRLKKWNSNNFENNGQSTNDKPVRKRLWE